MRSCSPLRLATKELPSVHLNKFSPRGQDCTTASFPDGTAPLSSTAAAPCLNLAWMARHHGLGPAREDPTRAAPCFLKRPPSGPSRRVGSGRYARWARTPDARPADLLV